MLDFDFSIEHVLILIVIFLLYHLINKCVCKKRVEGFRNFIYQSEPYCDFFIYNDLQICYNSFYFHDSMLGGDDNFHQCRPNQNETACEDSNRLCEGWNCPNCEAYMLKNIGLEIDNDTETVKTKPLDCNNIHNIPECQETYIKMWNKDTNITFNNGDFNNSGDFILGNGLWNNNSIRTLCRSPMEAKNLKNKVSDTCNEELVTAFKELSNPSDPSNFSASDTEIIQNVKDTINNIENKLFPGVSCCGPTKKCTPEQNSKLQENYLEKIAFNKYCNKPNVCDENHECVGVYNASDNNGSGSLGRKCECKLDKQLNKGKCGVVSCKGQSFRNKDPNELLCSKYQHCVFNNYNDPSMPGFGKYECVND